MSTIGKIFLVLNLVLAGAFLGWAANSLGKTEEMKKQKDDTIASIQSEKAKLEADLDQTRSELKAEKSAKDAAQATGRQHQSDAERLQVELDAAKRANEGLRGDVAKINESLSGLAEKLQKLEQDKSDAVEKAHQAEVARDEAVRKSNDAEKAKRDAQDATAAAERQIADLERALASSKKEVASVTTQLQNLQAITGVAIKDITSQPQIECQVIKVDMSLKPGLVALNKGKKDGVQRGFTFEIYAGTTYKGQVKVESVTDDTCAAVIVVTAPGAQMSAGDRASSRI